MSKFLPTGRQATPFAKGGEGGLSIDLSFVIDLAFEL